MRALLDVNVLIALLDADHTLHAQALDWFSANAGAGWASCPITENGCVRIMSSPSYPNALPVGAVLERLADAIADESHEFWPDDISLLDHAAIRRDRIHGPRQLTDLYLLALAIHHHGRFVTFDHSIPLDSIRDAKNQHLVRL